MSAPIQNRYEFVYLFDVIDGNPNGDPDAGNMPRQDFEDGHGLVTDVCLKRKIRNFVELAAPDYPAHSGLNIYVREKALLNREHEKAYKALDLDPKTFKGSKDEQKARALTKWMCDNFFDVRAFGAVMTTEVNCGQVRGPVQLAFARSVDPITVQEIAVTRMAVTNEKDLEKERTIGRKFTVPYALYEAHGFISAPLAEKTGFSEDDLALLWQALQMMLEHDHSAARGQMAARALKVFKHASRLGNAPAHRLFGTVSVKKKAELGETPARKFDDYSVDWNKAAIPDGVEALDLL